MANREFASQPNMSKGSNTLKAKVKRNILLNRVFHHIIFVIFSLFLLRPFSIGFLGITYMDDILTIPSSGKYNRDGFTVFTYGDRLFSIFLLFILIEIVPLILIYRNKRIANKTFDWARITSKEEVGKVFYRIQPESNIGGSNNVPKYCFNLTLKKNVSDSITLLKTIFSQTDELDESLWSDNKLLDDRRTYSFTLFADPDGKVRSHGVLVHIRLENTSSDSTQVQIVFSPIQDNLGVTSIRNTSLMSTPTSLLTAQNWAQLVANELGVDNALVEEAFAKDVLLTSMMDGISNGYKDIGGAKGLGKTILKVTVLVAGAMVLFVLLFIFILG